MAIDISKSGTKIKVTDGTKESLFLPSQDMWYFFDDSGTSLELREKGTGGPYQAHSWSIPLSNLSVGGSVPANKAAALAALVTVFS